MEGETKDGRIATNNYDVRERASTSLATQAVDDFPKIIFYFLLLRSTLLPPCLWCPIFTRYLAKWLVGKSKDHMGLCHLEVTSCLLIYGSRSLENDQKTPWNVNTTFFIVSRCYFSWKGRQTKGSTFLCDSDVECINFKNIPFLRTGRNCFSPESLCHFKVMKKTWTARIWAHLYQNPGHPSLCSDTNYYAVHSARLPRMNFAQHGPRFWLSRMYFAYFKKDMVKKIMILPNTDITDFVLFLYYLYSTGQYGTLNHTCQKDQKLSYCFTWNVESFSSLFLCSLLGLQGGGPPLCPPLWACP